MSIMIYMENEESTQETNTSSQDNSINGLFDMLSGIDIDKIADGLNGMKKVLSILGELSATQEDKNMQNPKPKPFSRDDD